jgi:hypothetical protein
MIVTLSSCFKDQQHIHTSVWSTMSLEEYNSWLCIWRSTWLPMYRNITELQKKLVLLLKDHSSAVEIEKYRVQHRRIWHMASRYQLYKRSDILQGDVKVHTMRNRGQMEITKDATGEKSWRSDEKTIIYKRFWSDQAYICRIMLWATCDDMPYSVNDLHFWRFTPTRNASNFMPVNRSRM